MRAGGSESKEGKPLKLLLGSRRFCVTEDVSPDRCLECVAVLLRSGLLDMKAGDEERDSAFRDREFQTLRRKGVLLEMVSVLLVPEGSAWSAEVSSRTRRLLDLVCGHEKEQLIALSKPLFREFSNQMDHLARGLGTSGRNDVETVNRCRLRHLECPALFVPVAKR